MATNFPTSLDSLTNPTSGDPLSSPSHAAQHANVNDAVEALEAKVGVDGSAVTSSHDYILSNGVLPTLNVDSGVLVVDDTNNRVGVNDSTPSYALDVTGDINATGDLRIGGTAIGEYSDFSASVTFVNFTLGNGTIDHCYYTRVNDFVHYVGKVTLGSTSAITSNVLILLPVVSNGQERGAGTGVFTDLGVADYPAQAETRQGGPTWFVEIFPYNTSGTYATRPIMNATTPFTWGTGDSFEWTIVYRAA